MTGSGLNYRKMDLCSLWHPYTRRSRIDSEPLPLIVRGEGIHLFDDEGRRYVDAISSWWCCNLGHSNPRLLKAIEGQARKLQHSILGGLSHPCAVELAERLRGLFPGNDRHVMFASDGASAVESALKIAVQYWHNIGQPGRSGFASFTNAYHGDTLGAVSVGYMPSFHAAFKDLLFSVHRAEAPCCGMCTHGAEPASCSLQCFKSMEEMLDNHADQLAAVIVEPLCQGAAGMRIYTPRYLARLYEECREKNVLLIADEIAVGFGRTGRMFAFEHAGIDPDIVCVGKGLTAGYLPMSATVVKDALYDTFKDAPQDHTFYHGHTFGGNPIAAAAALEMLRIYDDDRIVERVGGLGKTHEARLFPIRELGKVLDVRCLGLIMAVELGDEPDDPAGITLAERVSQDLMAEEVLVRPLGNVVYLMPPLAISDRALDDLVVRFRDAIVRVCA